MITVGCTIHLRSGEVEMAITVGTKESAALVTISWKKYHIAQRLSNSSLSVSDEM